MFYLRSNSNHFIVFTKKVFFIAVLVYSGSLLNGAGSVLTSSYDNRGNLKTKSTYAYTTGTLGTASATVSYAYGNAKWKDLMTTYNGQSITYDGVGNPLTYRDGMTMTWVNGRQMATLTKSGATFSYSYDIDGCRTKKVANGVTTEYYLNDGAIVEEKAGSNIIRYLFDENGARFGFEYNGVKYFYVFNVQGDVIGITNTSNQLVVQYAYNAWGKLLSVTGSAATTIGVANPIRYRGYYYDTESGLYYLNSRYYDPETGRFVNADAVVGVNGDMATYNLFVYCGNNPVCRADTSGMFWWDVVVAAVAVVAMCTVVVIAAPVLAPVVGVATTSLVAGATATAGVASVTAVTAAAVATVEEPIVPNAKLEEREKSIPILPPPKSGTKIYRWGSHNFTNLTPREKDRNGLSFSLTPPSSGRYCETTIEEVNATGFLYAVVDGTNHVSVKPRIPTKMEGWIKSRGDAIPHLYTLMLYDITTSK